MIFLKSIQLLASLFSPFEHQDPLDLIALKPEQQKCELTHLKLEDSYDIIYSFNKLEWSDNPSFLFDTIYDHLNDEGQCLLVVSPKDSDQISLFNDALLAVGLEPYPFLCIDDYRKKALELGFKIKHLEVARRIVTYNSVDALKFDIEKVALKIVPQEYLSEFVNVFTDFALKRAYLNQPGSLIIPSKVLILYLQKPSS